MPSGNQKLSIGSELALIDYEGKTHIYMLGAYLSIHRLSACLERKFDLDQGVCSVVNDAKLP